MPSGGRTFVVAFAVIVALLIGLVAGFAGGFFVARQADWIPAPRSAAQAVAPVPTPTAQPRTYTDAPVSEVIRESAPVEHPDPDVAPTRPTNAIDPQPREVNTMRRGPLGSAAAGSLQIASRPTGAQVFVDDVRVGVTPMSLAEISAGSHRVRMELPGFRPWVTAVNVESGARARVGASLEKE